MKSFLEEFNQLVMGRLFGVKEIKRDPVRFFPKGLRYRYYSVKRGNREWKYCYSTTRNENGKFASWVYMPKGKGRWTERRFRQLRSRTKSKARAMKLRDEFDRRKERKNVEA